MCACWPREFFSELDPEESEKFPALTAIAPCGHKPDGFAAVRAVPDNQQQCRHEIRLVSDDKPSDGGCEPLQPVTRTASSTVGGTGSWNPSASSRSSQASFFAETLRLRLARARLCAHARGLRNVSQDTPSPSDILLFLPLLSLRKRPSGRSIARRAAPVGAFCEKCPH